MSDPPADMRSAHPEVDVWAAGGIISRESKHGPKVLLVHRPRYDDWSFPKGKLEPGESLKAAARREVREETGFKCRLGSRLPEILYRDSKNRVKCVVYWLMSIESGSFEVNSEVDEIRWLTPKRALKLLDYERDADLLRTAVARHPTMAE